MAAGGWVAELDKKEHKNWVMCGCALNIAKNGIVPKIQKEMEAWYHSLISSPPLHSLAPCTCTTLLPKCATCNTWKSELTHLPGSRLPKEWWKNSDRKQWGSPKGVWELAKVFMPPLGSRKMDVVDAETTDVGGLLNLLERCPFMKPPVSGKVLRSARDECRNHWAHAPKQELQDVEVNTIFGHLNSLLNDPVFNTEKPAQDASKYLQALFHQGLGNVIDSEVEALNLLRQSLVVDLKTCQDYLVDAQNQVAQLDAATKLFNKDVNEVREQSELNREEIGNLSTKMSEVEIAALKDIAEVKEKSELNREQIGNLGTKVCEVEIAAQKDISEVKEKSELNRETIDKQRQQLETKLREVEANLSGEISTILHAVDDFNGWLNERVDLRENVKVIHNDVEDVRRGVQNAVVEVNATKSKLANFETNLESVKSKVQENKSRITWIEQDVETMKDNTSQGESSGNDDVLCTAPSRLLRFTGRKSALEWLEGNLVLESVDNGLGSSCCTKAICSLGGCGKTSLAVEFAWRNTDRFPGGVFWINGESNGNIRKSVAEILSLVNISVSTSIVDIDYILNRLLPWLSNRKFPWLLVLDNADELDDSTCPTGIKKICRGPWQRNSSASKYGHILLTTRQNAKNTSNFLNLSSGDCFKLECFSEEEGARFLMQRTGIQGESLDPDAIRLSKELGSLPLALEQAGAYVAASPLPLGFKDYLDKYQVVKVHLLKRQPATALSVEAQYRLSVHTTWEMNFDFVKNKSPAAATMMRIAAFLESDNIPIDVINPGFPELDQEELRECARSKIDIADILKVMSSYSLFSVCQETKVFGVHKLVQELVRDSLTPLERIETMVAGSRLLHFAFRNSRQHFDLDQLDFCFLVNADSLIHHMRNEINLSDEQETVSQTLFNDDFFILCENLQRPKVIHEQAISWDHEGVHLTNTTKHVVPRLTENVLYFLSAVRKRRGESEFQALLQGFFWSMLGELSHRK